MYMYNLSYLYYLVSGHKTFYDKIWHDITWHKLLQYVVVMHSIQSNVRAVDSVETEVMINVMRTRVADTTCDEVELGGLAARGSGVDREVSAARLAHGSGKPPPPAGGESASRAVSP